MDARTRRRVGTVGRSRWHTVAERFWEKVGYTEVKLRKGVEMKERIFDMRIMAKPLGGGTIAEYRSIMPRDDP